MTKTTTTLPAGTLLRALAPMIVKRAPVPVLTCVQVTPDGLAAFDYETTRTWSTTTGTTPGATPAGPAFLVPAADLHAAVKGLVSGLPARSRELEPVTITATMTGATVTAAGMSVPVTTPAGVKLDECPDLPAPVDGAMFTITADHLATIATHVAPVIDRDVPVLTAVRLTVADGDAIWTATDRYRAHRATTSTDVYAVADDANVPAAFLVGFHKLIKGERLTGPVTVTVQPESKGTTTRRVQLSAGGHTWSTVQTEGTYPAIGRIIDAAETGGTRGQVPADMLAAVVKRAAALVPDPARGLILLDSDGDVIRVAADLGGDASPVLVGIVPSSAPAFDATGVNVRYLVAALAAHAGAVDTVLTWSAPGKPVLLTSGAVTTLVMPVRIPGGGAATMPATPATMTPEAATRTPRAPRTTTPAPAPAEDPRVAELAAALAAVTAERDQLAADLAAARETTTSTATSTPATVTAGGEHKHRALPGDDVPPRCACGFRQSRTPAPGRALSDHLARFRNR